MRTAEELRNELRGMDRRSYPAYKALAGTWQFEKYRLTIDHVQGDPFASPSSLHVELSHRQARIPERYYENPYAKTALRDYIVREAGRQFEKYNFKAKGSGKSGLISTTHCGQEVLERSACQVLNDRIIARFHVGFPAFGRSINAGELEKILLDFLPRCVENIFFSKKLDAKKLETAIHLYEDQQELRALLQEHHLKAFVKNGAILPRKSGVSDLPMKDPIPFCSPASMEQTFVLKHTGAVTGMAIPEGITLLVGGGYHGKSTLLEALQTGVYNHIYGDGREFVITDATAIKLRAEDGRSVRNVNISMFINDLPNKKDTTCFSSMDASGSTSQAAGVIESLEAGAHLFLIDEDTSATNFMLRDEFMQQVISREKEPITPFLERARNLYERAGVSTILVAGSSGAFFYIADHVIQMDNYHPVEITEKVKALCNNYPTPRTEAPDFQVPKFDRTIPPFRRTEDSRRSRCGRNRGDSNSRATSHEHMKTKLYGKDSFSIDKETVDLRYVEQLVDAEQTAALSYFLRYGLEQIIDGQKTVQETAEQLMKLMDQKGWLPFCSSYIPCGLAKPRIQELYACLNRFRG